MVKKIIKPILIFSVVAGSTLISTGCKSKKTESIPNQQHVMQANTDQVTTQNSSADQKTSVEQKTCPVMGSPINKELYVDYNGKRIYVCCKGCIGDIKNDPEKYLKKLAELGEHAVEIK